MNIPRRVTAIRHGKVDSSLCGIAWLVLGSVIVALNGLLLVNTHQLRAGLVDGALGLVLCLYGWYRLPAGPYREPGSDSGDLWAGEQESARVLVKK